MKKNIISIIFLIITLTGFSQSKDTFYLWSVPAYDEFGNLYQVEKSYNHIPTKEDSINFKKQSNIELNLWMDSLRKLYYVPKRKINYKKNKNKKS